MDKRKLSIILLIISLLVFLPVFRTPTVITSIPFQNHTLLVNVQSSSVQITSSNSNPISMNISYIIPGEDEPQLIDTTFLIDSYILEIDYSERGNYIFSFTSERISEISIIQNGIPLDFIVVFGLILVLNIIITVRNKNQIIIA